MNLLGHLLFLLPLAGFIVWVSWDYTGRAWSIREGSAEVGGIEAVFLLKTLIPVLGGLLVLQGMAEVARIALRLLGRGPAIELKSEPSSDARVPAPVDVRRSLRAPARGLSGRAHARRRRPALRLRRHRRRRVRPRRHRVPVRAHLRNDHQPDADRCPAVRADGCDPREIEGRGAPARRLFSRVRTPARRPRSVRHLRRHAHGGEHRHRRRHGCDHGPDVAAHHAPPWLRHAPGDRHHRRHRHARPDHSAVDRPRIARRRPVERLPAGAAQHGHLLAGHRVGRRSLCRRARSRPAAGRVLHALGGRNRCR